MDTQAAVDSPFRVGNGVGPFGRWFRLFAGLNAILYLSINPILLHPEPKEHLGTYFGEVGLWFILIAGVYLLGVWLFGRLLFSRLNPWTGTAMFLDSLTHAGDPDLPWIHSSQSAGSPRESRARVRLTRAASAWGQPSKYTSSIL